MSNRFYAGQADYIQKLNDMDDAGVRMGNSYYGSFATAPTLRPDGTARVAGDRYFDTVAIAEKTWNGTAWYVPNIDSAALATSSGAGLVGWIRSAIGAVATTVAKWIGFQPYSVFDFMTDAQIADVRSGAPVLDHTAAVQAAVTASTNLFFPEGSYRLNGTVSKVTTGSMRLSGAGLGITFILQYADANTFSITNTGGGSGQFVVENMTLAPRISMVAGAALNFRNDSSIPSVRVQNVFIGSSSTYEFKYGIKTKNCAEAVFDRVVMYGLGTSNLVGWDLTATQAATTPKWVSCSVYNALFAVAITNSTNPGIEGIQFYGCDFVGVAYGVICNNTFGPTYLPPQMLWIGGHINASIRNFDLKNISQITISDTLLYNSGIGPFINLDTCSGYTITDTQFRAIGGTAIGVAISTATDPMDGGVISGSNFAVAGTINCISIDATKIIQNLRITNNLRTTGAKTVNVSAGVLNNSVIIKDNTPDAEDISETIAVSGGNTLSLTGTRSDFFIANGTGTITSLVSRRTPDRVTLKSDTTTLILQHNGVNPDGFQLKGGVNFTFSAGSLITLEKRNGGYWTEVSRSV